MATVSQQQQKNDYFASTQSVAEEGQAASLSAELTKSAVITAEDLNELMKSKYSILIIDVRSREAFTQGHIWTAATICIEPTILNRGDMSATEISESLVLSADKEKAAFEDRFKYDFVVFHDQDTENMPEYPKSVADQALTRLRRALVDFSYGTSKLKNPPKLLKGGIDAWVDLMGPSALESGTNSITMAARINNTSQQRQRRNFPVKSLSRNEVETWQDIVNKENTQTASAPAYARSQEEFLRRYPPVVLEQESMTGHTNTNRSSRYGPSVIDLNTDLPTPPTRPAPAVARPSYSGISQALNDDSTYDDTGAPQTQNSLARPKPGEQINVDAMNKTPTGLVNPGNWCYANSILQALLASPGFGRELADSSWQQYARVPRKRNEKIDNPQLMMKILSNLFHWMNTRKFNSMQAQTLMV
jgi:ubiquitin carboxyl-terminal hydrolase 8